MIEWNIPNTYYFAAIVTGLLLIGIYFLYVRREG